MLNFVVRDSVCVGMYSIVVVGVVIFKDVVFEFIMLGNLVKRIW